MPAAVALRFDVDGRPVVVDNERGWREFESVMHVVAVRGDVEDANKEGASLAMKN